jgi:hypothetical protein
MEKNNTWIKLYRNFKYWHWYKNTNTKTLFIHMLMECNYVDYRFEKLIIKRGQLIVGREKLAEETGLSEQMVRTALNNLISTNDIITKPFTKFTLVTIVNYDKYQSTNLNEQTSNQQVTNEQPTNNQQVTNEQPQLKKEKKDNKEKKEINITTTTAKLESNLILINSISKELNISNEIVITQIQCFVNYCNDIKKEHKDDTDLFKHFGSWIGKQKFNKINIDSPEFNEKVNWFIGLFNSISKGRFKVTKEVKRLFAIQLENGFTGDEMKIAITNLYSTSEKNKFHKDNSYQFATPAFLLKNENINTFLNARFNYIDKSELPIYRRKFS